MISAAIGIGMQKDEMQMKREQMAAEAENTKFQQMATAMRIMLSGQELGLAEKKYLSDIINDNRRFGLDEKKFALDELNSATSRASSEASAAYNRALTNQVQNNPADQMFIESAPGFPKGLTLRQFDALDSDTKEYISYYAANKDNKDVLSQSEFKNVGKSTVPKTPFTAAMENFRSVNGREPTTDEMIQMQKDINENTKATGITWQNAISNIDDIYVPKGTVDKITYGPGEKFEHLTAIKKLNSLKDSGLDPQTAQTAAVDYAKTVRRYAESLYDAEVSKARALYSGNRLSEELSRINEDFQKEFGYEYKGGK